jgi:hypothetical protein
LIAWASECGNRRNLVPSIYAGATRCVTAITQALRRLSSCNCFGVLTRPASSGRSSNADGMPQGPTSQGCDACRAQHKRVSRSVAYLGWQLTIQCDQDQPKCSRCTRLRIPCVGAGVRPLRFKAHQPPTYRARARAQRHSQPTICIISRSPNSETACLTQALITRILPSNDYRYWLAWVHGPFIVELPRRIGHNPFLDHAVNATLAMHVEACLRKHEDDPRAAAGVAYFRAIRSLRTILTDPREALTCDTTCGVLLLLSAHARLDGPFSTFCSPHGSGLLQLLRLREPLQQTTPPPQHEGTRPTVDVLRKYHLESSESFEEVTLLSMPHIAVLLQSFVNPQVILLPEEYHGLETSIVGNDCSTRGVRCLIRLSELMAETRVAFRLALPLNSYIGRANALHLTAQGVVKAHHTRLQDLAADTSHHPDRTVRLHAIYTRTHGMALMTEGFTICLRRALQPESEQLRIDAAAYTESVVQAKALAQRYLPLGAAWMGWSCIIAWCVTRGLRERVTIESELLAYLKATRGEGATLRSDLLGFVEKRLWCGRVD